MDTSCRYFDSKSAKRTKLRLIAGRLWYRYRRYVQWYFSGRAYACARSDKPLPYICTGHSTPLVRKLNGADMELQRNKVTNLRLAAAKLNGVVLKPGETQSFWKLVGKPTKRKGYLPGMILVGGKIGSGIGGGLCQMANLVYWMTLHTELSVTERHRHSYDVFPDSNRTQPFGSGATCAYNHLDLQIANNTGAPYQLLVSVSDGYLKGSWRCGIPTKLCYKVYERDARIIPSAWGGYIRHNAIWRTIRDETGVVLRDEKIAENNAKMMYQPLLAETGRAVKANSSGNTAPALVNSDIIVYTMSLKNKRAALQSMFH